MPGDLQTSFGRHLRAERLRRGLSQEELGQQIGYDRTYIGGVERGERNLTLQTVEAMAKRLGLDPRDMLAPAT